LLQSNQESNFSQRYVNSTSNYAEITGMPSAAKYKTWQAHDVYHRPTYFEDQNLELNGNQRAFQNVASAVSFFSTIPLPANEQPQGTRIANDRNAGAHPAVAYEHPTVG